MASIHRPLEKESYYHGLISRDDVNELLKNEGDFLVSKAKPKDGAPLMNILSVCCNNKAWDEARRNQHLTITFLRNKYFVKKYSFDTVQQMIEYHLASKEAVQDGVTIKSPVIRQSWQLERESIVVQNKLRDGEFGDISMGTYYKQDGFILDVAVKQARFEKLSSAQAKKFMGEARILRTLSHPNIIKCHGVVTGLDPVYLVTEQAPTLSDYLDNHPNLPMLILDEMCLQAAWGLEYLHSKGIIHRELTAMYCIYQRDTVKIADFRSAYQGYSYQGEMKQPVLIVLIAPECLFTRLYTQKTDVWSFGMLCVKIYSNGAELYPGMPTEELISRVYYREVADIPANVNPKIAQMITEECFSYSPNDRSPMNEICRMLQTITGIERPNFDGEPPKVEKDKKKDK